MQSVRTPAPRLARGQRVDEILVAARAVFCDKGYEQAAMSSIAARIGVVEGTLYKYFASKHDLLLAVLEHWYGELFGNHAQELAGMASARAGLHRLVWHHLAAIRDEPQLCRLMFREVRSEADYHGSRLHTLNRQYTGLLVQVLAQGVASGEFRAGIAPALLRDMVYGAIEHHSWNYLCGRGALAIDSLAEQIVAVVCDGIAAPAAIRKPSPKRKPA